MRDDVVAIRKIPDFHVSVSGIQNHVITTKYYAILVKWTYQSTSWLPLWTINKSNPIEVAEYDVSNSHDKGPTFNWWVRTVLKQRDRLIKKVKLK